jgi:hypothetical protein
MVHIYYEITIYIYKAIFPSGAYLPLNPTEGVTPSSLPHVEECTLFWGVNSSWGINTTENKYL